jgi:hypothetical protein
VGGASLASVLRFLTCILADLCQQFNASSFSITQNTSFEKLPIHIILKFFVIFVFWYLGKNSGPHDS